MVLNLLVKSKKALIKNVLAYNKSINKSSGIEKVIVNYFNQKIRV